MPYAHIAANEKLVEVILTKWFFRFVFSHNNAVGHDHNGCRL